MAWGSPAQRAALAKAQAASAAKRHKKSADAPASIPLGSKPKPKRTAADYRAAGDASRSGRIKQMVGAGDTNRRGNPRRSPAERSAGVRRGAGVENPESAAASARSKIKQERLAKALGSKPKPTLKSKGTYDNRYNDPTDPTSGILGTEMRNGEWVPKLGYRKLNRYPGDPAYGPSPNYSTPKYKDGEYAGMMKELDSEKDESKRAAIVRRHWKAATPSGKKIIEKSGIASKYLSKAVQKNRKK